MPDKTHNGLAPAQMESSQLIWTPTMWNIVQDCLASPAGRQFMFVSESIPCSDLTPMGLLNQPNSHGSPPTSSRERGKQQTQDERQSLPCPCQPSGNPWALHRIFSLGKPVRAGHRTRGRRQNAMTGWQGDLDATCARPLFCTMYDAMHAMHAMRRDAAPSLHLLGTKPAVLDPGKSSWGSISLRASPKTAIGCARLRAGPLVPLRGN